MKPIHSYLFLLLLVGATWSCSDSDASLQSTGRLNVFMVDAPFPTDLVSEANVTVFRVEARLSEPDMEVSGEAAEMPGEDNSASGGFITLMEDDIPLNLLDLVGGVTEQLVSAEIPAGCYDLIRVYVKGVNVVMQDGTQYDLKVPSGAQTGIKIFMDPCIAVVGGLSADLILDFDVSQSFVPKGDWKSPEGINGFNFTPVIRGSNQSTSGTLSGLVTTPGAEETTEVVAGAMVTLYAPDDTEVASTSTDAEGQYEMAGVNAGTYRMEVTLEGFQPQSVEGIEIAAGNKTIQDVELVAEEATDE